MPENMPWNIFEDDTPVAVVVINPEKLTHKYLYQLAFKFGEIIPPGDHVSTIFLYGMRSHGSSSDHDHILDDKNKREVVKMYVPKWLTGFEYLMAGMKGADEEKAYKRGKEHGKNLLKRLSDGDMSVLDFEDHRS